MANVLSRIAGNAGGTVVDQALSALSNTVLTVVVANMVGKVEFGAFSIALVVFSIAVSLTRSLVGQPLQIRYAAAPAAELHRATARALGTSVVLGVVLSLCCLIAAAIVPDPVRQALLAIAVVLPALMLQDTCRLVFFALARPWNAAAVDGLWTLLLFPLLAWMTSRPEGATVPQMITAWGACAAVSAILGLALLRSRPDLRSAWSWTREMASLSRYLLPEYLLGLGSMQIAILCVGAIASEQAVGALNGAQKLLGPLSIVGVGIFQFAVPEVARRNAEMTPLQRYRFAVAISAVLGVGTVAYLVLLLLMPQAWGEFLFDETWAGAAAVLLPMGLSSLSSSLANGPAGVLYGMGRAESTFRINLIKGPVLLLAMLAGTWQWGAVGAAWGLMAAETLVLPLWIRTLRRVVSALPRTAARESVTSSASAGKEASPVGRQTRQTPDAATGRLYLVVRSYGGENTKNRPGYYSKMLCLASVVRAARRAPEARVVFLNDGPIPANRLALMHAHGGLIRSVTDTPDAGPAGLRTSYLAGLALPDELGWDDQDVVFFIEDDYLFTEDAVRTLARAIAEMPQADYFSLYGERPDLEDPAERRRFCVPDAWQPTPDQQLAGDVWFNQPAIASTFGARVGALRADRDIFVLCMKPFRTRFLDHETCLIYQGTRPYHGSELFTGLPGDLRPTARGLLRAAYLSPYRFTLNRRADRQRPAHRLYAVTPNRATHVEVGVTTDDQDWPAVAAEVTRWAAAAGHEITAARTAPG